MVCLVRQTSNVSDLLEQAKNMSLLELESLFRGRFAKGEVREMKQEFDNIIRSSSTSPFKEENLIPPECITSDMLEDLLIRGTMLAIRFHPNDIQKAVVMVKNSKKDEGSVEVHRESAQMNLGIRFESHWQPYVMQARMHFESCR